MKWEINRSKTSFERKTRPWFTPSFTVAATHYAIVQSSSSTLIFFLTCIHSPSNIALTSKIRLEHTKRLMVSHRFYCDQSLLHLRALLNLWSVVLTFEDLITFVTSYCVCGFSRVSLRLFFSIEIFKRWKKIPLHCPLKNWYTRSVHSVQPVHSV